MSVSRETLISAYVDLLLRWSGSLNLSSAREREAGRIHEHIKDSLSLVPYLPESLDRLIDLGSGQGFPAIPIAVQTGVEITLIEADRRKAAFLTTAMATLGLAGQVLPTRIEHTTLRRAQCVTARALAPLSRLLPLARPFVAQGGCCLFLKGPSAQAEAEEAHREHAFEHRIAATASPRSNIVIITGLH